MSQTKLVQYVELFYYNLQASISSVSISDMEYVLKVARREGIT